MIIGLTGYAQSGKDTVANILVENYGFTRVAFADKLRDFLYEFNPPVDCDGLPDVQEIVDVNGWDVAKVKYPNIRKQLQDIGLAARKVFGDQFWIQQALKDVHFEGNFVITDIRFPNEAAAIRKYDNSQIWRIQRNGVKPVNQHISEIAMDNEKVDQLFMNSGSIEDLNALIGTRMRAFV